MDKPKQQEVRLLQSHGPTNSTIFVLGATGSGKTTVMANLLREEPRWIIFDTRNEFIADFFHEEIVATVRDIKEFVLAINSGVDRIIFDMSAYANVEEILNASLLQVFAFQEANSYAEIPAVTIALDELNRFVDSRRSPMSGFKEVIQRGRLYGIKKLFGAQWFGNLPTWARDSFSELYIFRHNDRAGLALLECYGLDTEQVKILAPHTAIHVASGGIELIAFTARDEGNEQPPSSKEISENEVASQH